MNCRICQRFLLDYLEGMLSADAAREVETHTAGCPACRMELALAQKIESALSSQRLRMPSPDFTARVLSALAGARAVPVSFWSQALPLAAYAASALALVLGLGRYLPYITHLYEAWSDRISTLALVLGLRWPETAGEPGRIDAFIQWLRETSEDIFAYLTAYREEISWLYSANAPAVHLAIAALAVVWVLYEYRQGAKA